MRGASRPLLCARSFAGVASCGGFSSKTREGQEVAEDPKCVESERQPSLLFKGTLHKPVPDLHLVPISRTFYADVPLWSSPCEFKH